MKLVSLKFAEKAHAEGIWAAAWAPATDARAPLLLTAAMDETVRVWQGDDLQPGGINEGHKLGVIGMAVDPASKLAACSAMDSRVRVFDLDTNATVATLESFPSETWGVSFHPQGQSLAVAAGGSGTVKVWNTASWQLESSLQVPRKSPEGGSEPSTSSEAAVFVLAVAWSCDGRRLACSTYTGVVAVFDWPKGKLLHSLEGHHMPVRSLAFSPTEPRLLFTACDDRHVHMYDVEAGVLVTGMSGHSSWVLAISSAPDGKAIATGSTDRTVRLWDLSTRTCVQTERSHEDQVWAVAFCPPPIGGGGGGKGQRLASASDDCSIALYDYT